ncbi:MAG TPA: DcaP family trimeric outer membrane transporter [Myxococcota bacterium]
MQRTLERIIAVALVLLGVWFAASTGARAEQADDPAATAEAAAKADPRASGEAPSPAEEMEAEMRERYGIQDPVTYRGTFDDKQEAAPRPGDYTLDPQYRGFIPVPNTVFMIKFNPKPRLDMTLDSKNAGSEYRFVPAKFPVEGMPDYGGGWRFNANGNGSQLRLDVQAPAAPGNFRFYYQNDFFGSDEANFRYRLQHLYGQYHGVVAGFTYGIFENPDAWPDTVDYEGPNSVIFARRPLVHYTKILNEDWQLTVGLEDPDIYVDNTGASDAKRRTRAPDGGFNIRWFPGDLGHMQFSTIFRSVGIAGEGVHNDDVFGWGVNLSGSLNVTSRDTLQLWFVYGRGVGGMGNDTSFVNSDAALNADGSLEALEYGSTMIALSHRWTPRWRSTLTHGYANLANTALQAGDAYHVSHYASVNLVYKVLKRLSVGIEGLYGYHKVNDGSDVGLYRIQVGLVYSLFD